MIPVSTHRTLEICAREFHDESIATRDEFLWILFGKFYNDAQNLFCFLLHRLLNNSLQPNLTSAQVASCRPGFQKSSVYFSRTHERELLKQPCAFLDHH